jgi:hypothetical protein
MLRGLMTPRRLLVAAASSALLAWACLGGPHATLEIDPAAADGAATTAPDGAALGPRDGAASNLFIATSSDFTDFRKWTRFDLGEGIVTDGVHIAGPRSVYINKMPPKGSTTFPIGTLIVKAVQNGTPDQWQIFALAKRGASFNVFGALDWEWFGLQLFPSGVVTIEWRGIGPPADAGYGGPAGNPCNNCHRAAQSNDFVHTPALELNRL